MGRATLGVLAGILFWSGCYAADSGYYANGQQGQLRINGSFLEAPCTLTMRSEFQDVALDSAAIALMKKPGDTGVPKEIVFHLMGCKTPEGNNKLAGRDAKVRFMSEADPDEPTLFRLTGVTGIGLRLQDLKGRMIIPGASVEPLFTSESVNELTYRVIPVRTKAPLSTGNFKATVDFGMSYE